MAEEKGGKGKPAKPEAKEAKPEIKAEEKAPAAAAPAAKPKPEKKRKEGKNLSQKWKLYELSGEKTKKKRKTCPKCGEGVFLAQHKSRDSCGKCGYTEFRKTEEKK